MQKKKLELKHFAPRHVGVGVQYCTARLRTVVGILLYRQQKRDGIVGFHYKKKVALKTNIKQNI